MLSPGGHYYDVAPRGRAAQSLIHRSRFQILIAEGTVGGAGRFSREVIHNVCQPGSDANRQRKISPNDGGDLRGLPLCIIRDKLEVGSGRDHLVYVLRHTSELLLPAPTCSHAGS